MLTTEDKEFIVDVIDTRIVKSIDSLRTELTEQIDALAMITARGFERVDKRFEEVDRKFEEVDQKFIRLEQKMEYRFEGVNRRLDDLATNRVRNDIYEGLEKRVNKLEKAVYAKI